MPETPIFDSVVEWMQENFKDFDPTAWEIDVTEEEQFESVG